MAVLFFKILTDFNSHFTDYLQVYSNYKPTVYASFVDIMKLRYLASGCLLTICYILVG